MIPLAEAAALPQAGAKARSLARARAAGLPVLDGLVVLPDDEVDGAELAAALRRLGGERFAVRSSATLEDLPGASAAGVFDSFLDVPAARVADAIERVRRGALAQPAQAYLGARGLLGGRLAMSVLVQPMAGGGRLGVLHTAPLDEDGAMPAEERPAGEPEHGVVLPRPVAPGEPLAVLARAAAVLVGSEVDVEYALSASGPVLLQLRPLGTTPPRRQPARFAGGPAGRWRLDAEHNPDPLSAAQASLVGRLSAVAGLPAQRLVNGWLYVAEAEVAGSLPPALPGRARARFAERIAPLAEAALAPLEAAPEPPLAPSLQAFDEVARLHGVELRPLLRTARRALDRLLQRSIGEPLTAHADLLAGTGGHTLRRDQSLWEIGRASDDGRRAALLSAHLRAHGAYAPAWDVAVAPDDEDIARVLRAAALLSPARSPEALHPEALARAEAAARRLADRLGPAERRELAELLPPLREAMAVAEDDDVLFFRAQRLVRRALLALGRGAVERGRLQRPEQVLDLPIEAVAAGAIDAAQAADNASLRIAQGRLWAPTIIEDGVPRWRGGGEGGVLHGAGTGGRASGRALVLRDPAQAPATLPAGAVLVLRAVLPSFTYLLPAAAALVTDEGGGLSHAATLAREYGLPAVLGTGSASRALQGGEELLVDGDHGRVFRLGGG